MANDTPFLTSDVIVVGYGAAGGSAALTAYDNGAKTLILEKMDQPGGNSLVSSAMMVYPQDPTDVDKLTGYLTEVCNGVVDPELIQTFVTGLMENEAWFETLGGELEVYDYKTQDPSYSYYIPDVTFFQIPQAQGLNLVLKHLKQTATVPEPTGGSRVWHLLNREIEKRDIKVLRSTPVKRLVKNDAGEIIGVMATVEGQDYFFEARKAVIMTCGGFEYNDALKWDNLRPQPVHTLGNPSNTGDGIQMVQEIGAALWHMSAQASTFGFRPPDWEAGFALTLRQPGFIYVDKYGNRFIDETRLEAHNASFATDYFDLRNYEYPRLPSFLIMDEENACGKPLAMNIFSYNVVVKGYVWSADNSEEIKKGWIVRADTLAKLGKLLNIDEATLQETLTRYNNFCRTGVDADFGRSSTAMKPIKPPYYAMRLEPLLYNTQGGPRRDQEARVLAPDGSPIPRLYAAGEFGSIWGFRYQTSTNFSETLVYGRLAGKNAALLPAR
jgi:succinate dehydrogenase/fumarate reductase flavoprotein subunit